MENGRMDGATNYKVTCLAYVHNTVHIHIHNIHEILKYIYTYIYTLRTAIKRIKAMMRALKLNHETNRDGDMTSYQGFPGANLERFLGYYR